MNASGIANAHLLSETGVQILRRRWWCQKAASVYAAVRQGRAIDLPKWIAQ